MAICCFRDFGACGIDHQRFILFRRAITKDGNVHDTLITLKETGNKKPAGDCNRRAFHHHLKEVYDTLYRSHSVYGALLPEIAVISD